MRSSERIWSLNWLCRKLRWLDAGQSQWRLVFCPWQVYVEFVVGKVAMGHVFLRVLRISLVNIIPPAFPACSFIYYRNYKYQLLTGSLNNTL